MGEARHFAFVTHTLEPNLLPGMRRDSDSAKRRANVGGESGRNASQIRQFARLIGPILRRVARMWRVRNVG